VSAHRRQGACEQQDEVMACSLQRGHTQTRPTSTSACGRIPTTSAPPCRRQGPPRHHAAAAREAAPRPTCARPGLCSRGQREQPQQGVGGSCISGRARGSGACAPSRDVHSAQASGPGCAGEAVTRAGWASAAPYTKHNLCTHIHACISACPHMCAQDLRVV